MTRSPKSMRRSVLSALAVACIVVPSAMAGSPPAGATARCRDGTYSFSQHRSGTCSDHGGVAAWLGGGPPASGGSSPGTPGAAAPPAIGSTVLLGPRTQTRRLPARREPDRRCSPGAYYSGLTTAVICASTFRTGTIRDVPEAEKFAVEREYGMPARGYGYTIEIDHIVALELGGSNDIANLFPGARIRPGQLPRQGPAREQGARRGLRRPAQLAHRAGGDGRRLGGALPATVRSHPDDLTDPTAG